MEKILMEKTTMFWKYFPQSKEKRFSLVLMVATLFCLLWASRLQISKDYLQVDSSSGPRGGPRVEVLKSKNDGTNLTTNASTMSILKTSFVTTSVTKKPHSTSLNVTMPISKTPFIIKPVNTSPNVSTSLSNMTILTTPLRTISVVTTPLSTMPVSTTSIVTTLIETTPRTTEKKIRYLTIKHEQGRLGNNIFEYASVLGIGNLTGRHAFVRPYSNYDLAKLFTLTHVEDRNIDSFKCVEETMYGYFDPIFQNLPDQDVIIDGYVQSWKYFDHIKDKIRAEMTIQPSFRDEAEKVREEIRHERNRTDLVFVGVHVRLKDEKSLPITLEAPRSYFTNAFNKMRELLRGQEIVFLVAGNNLQWCQDNLNASDVVVLKDASPERHFAVLSTCQHGIVTIGSYGWWAAWLTGGHVVFYKKFPAPDTYEFKGFVYKDYYPPHWFPVDD